jgi:outer membrane lipopolysaccharide assembly protein LptE/RlpB
MTYSFCSRLLLSLSLVASGIAVAGCGYHVAGHASTLPKTVHVIAVPAMENKTSSYRIEQKLTTATVHEFLAKTRYRIVPDPNAADAVLRGKVISIEVTPLTFQTSTTTSGPANAPIVTSIAQATSMLVIMRCEVTLTERENDKILYHANNFVFRNEYQLAATNISGGAPSRASVESFFQEGDPAIDRMAQDFAERLVSAVLENY